MPAPKRKSGAIGRLAAGLVIFVMLLGTLGLFGIYNEHRRTERVFQSIEHLGQLEADLRSSLTGFKVEVQEWKNLLLRGQDAEGFAQWKKTHKERVDDTDKALGRLKNRAELTPEDQKKLDEVIRQHTENAAFYDTALASYKLGDPASILVVDKMVRGRDRQIAAILDELANTIRTREEAEMATARKEADAYYGNFQTIIVIVAAITTLLTFILAVRVARSESTP